MSTAETTARLAVHALLDAAMTPQCFEYTLRLMQECRQGNKEEAGA